MKKKKLTTSIMVSQEALLRRSSPSVRTVGWRVGSVAELLRNDWLDAVWKLETEFGWSRRQIERAARAVDGLRSFDYARVVAALRAGSTATPDPDQYQTYVDRLPKEYTVLIWQVSRELRLGNPETEAYLQELENFAEEQPTKEYDQRDQ